MNDVVLTDLVNLQDLNERMMQGYVNVREHPTLPLSIYNYSDSCLYDRVWDNTTEQCRGLIVENSTGRVIARGPRKFYNYGQPEAVVYPMDTLVNVTRKEDGSLGVVWKYKGHYGVATRGSFVSDQAIHATELLQTDEYMWLREGAYWYNLESVIVEIVYPLNRIVLNYGERDELIPLGLVTNGTGIIHTRDLRLLIKDAPAYRTVGRKITLAEAISLPVPDDEEGYVLDVLGADHRKVVDHLKLKGEKYLRDHKLISNLSERSIHGCLSDGSSIEEYISMMPDEWHDWCRDVAKSLADEYQNKLNDIEEVYKAIPETESKKEFASYATKSEHRAALFIRYDNREEDLQALVWKSITPAA